MVTTRPPKTIVKPTALGPVANTDTKLLIYGLFQKGRVLAQDGVPVVDEVSLAKEETIPHVREVSCHLFHPLPVGVRRYPTDAHAASGDIRETVRDYLFMAAPLLEGLDLGLAHRRIA